MSRLSINVNDETAANLRDLAARRGVSVTEIVRRAASVYAFLQSAQDDGERIQTVSESGETITVRLLA